LFKEIYLIRELARQPPIVAVQKSNVFAARSINSHIPSSGGTLITIQSDHSNRNSVLSFSDDFYGAVT
jgi:hypothetical protein